MEGGDFEHLRQWSANIVKRGKVKTEMEAPLSNKTKSSNLGGKEEASEGLKMYIIKQSRRNYEVSIVVCWSGRCQRRQSG